MAEQLVTMGTAIRFHPNSRSFVEISDGYYTIEAFVPRGTVVQIGRIYQVYKVGNTYHVGAEV